MYKVKELYWEIGRQKFSIKFEFNTDWVSLGLFGYRHRPRRRWRLMIYFLVLKFQFDTEPKSYIELEAERNRIN